MEASLFRACPVAYNFVRHWTPEFYIEVGGLIHRVLISWNSCHTFCAQRTHCSTHAHCPHSYALHQPHPQPNNTPQGVSRCPMPWAFEVHPQKFEGNPQRITFFAQLGEVVHGRDHRTSWMRRRGRNTTKPKKCWPSCARSGGTTQNKLAKPPNKLDEEAGMQATSGQKVPSWIARK